MAYPSFSVPSLFGFLTHFVSCTPIFRRSLFVLCCPSRKPVACILSSKHRTPLCSSVFKVLIKSWPAPEWDSWQGASAATASWEPSQYRPSRSLSSGPVFARSTGAWPTVKEGLSFPLLSTVRNTTTKGAPNNKGSPSEAPKLLTLVEQRRHKSVTHLASFNMIVMPAVVRMGCLLTY